MFDSPSPLASPYGYGYSQNFSKQWMSQNPQEVELMMKQKFQQSGGQNQMSFQNYQSDPYLELQNELSNCPISIKNKIFADKEYQVCDSECEMLLKQAIEEILFPQIINTPRGRITMEKFVGVVKQLKEKYSKEEAQTNEKLQTLLNDEVIKQRMQQLSAEKKSETPSHPNSLKGGGKA